MIKNYLLTALRNIFRHKGFSLLNIFGLSLSMSVCMLIIVILVDQFSYDSQHTKKERIYRVQTIDNLSDWSLNKYASTAFPLADELVNNYPFIEEAVLIRALSMEMEYLMIHGSLLMDCIRTALFSGSLISN